MQDHRCIHLSGRRCFNDLYKRQLQSEIGQVLRRVLRAERLSPPQLVMDKALDAIYEETRLGSLIEFSRAVHAEMDAILSIARMGVSGLMGATLFSTTFPCHSCARHIVAAGIARVVYIEPYDKSMAQDLHQDAIDFEASERDARSVDQPSPLKVRFEHFEGVAPRLFPIVFRSGSRKAERSGALIQLQQQLPNKVLPEYMDNYTDFEAAASQHYQQAYRHACGGQLLGDGSVR